MSTCSGDTVETSSIASAGSSTKQISAPLIALIIIIDDEPKSLTAKLEDAISTELKWRGIRVAGKIKIEPECGEQVYEEKVKLFRDAVTTSCENERQPCMSVIFVRVDPINSDNFKGVVGEIQERHSASKFWVCLMFTVGVLVINEVVKTEVLDFSNNGIWVAKYLARELIVTYTRHLGIHNNRRQMRGPPIVIFVRETPVVGQKSLSTGLTEALSMEPISFVHHRVSYLISQPDTISHLSELAKEKGHSSEDIIQGCRIYLRSALDCDLDSSAADVIIIDTLNDIYLDVDGMLKIAQEKASSVFIMEEATEETVYRIVDTMVWMIKRRCHYTDGPYADYFYTQMSLHKEMDTLRVFMTEESTVPEDEDSSTELGLVVEDEAEGEEGRTLPFVADDDHQVNNSNTNKMNKKGAARTSAVKENVDGGGAGDYGRKNEEKPAGEAVPSKG